MIILKEFKGNMKKITICLFLIICIHSQIRFDFPVQTIQPENMEQMLNILDSKLFDVPRPQVEIRKLLRASFHDCMGGCDGRINLKNTANRGLEVLVQVLSELYTNKNYPFSNYLSRADFFVLCYRRALAWGIKKAGNSDKVPILSASFPAFNYGRARNNYDSNFDDFEAEIPDGSANWTNTSQSEDNPVTVVQGMIAGLKGRIRETDIVTLFGLHSVGFALQFNAGYSGRWGNPSDRNTITNNYYKFLLGYFGKKYSFTQGRSSQKSDQVPYTPQFYSPPPDLNEFQWFNDPKHIETSRINLNADMGVYHQFRVSPQGEVKGKYCPQISNATLFDCSKRDSQYMPLGRNALQAFKYAHNLTLYLTDLFNSFYQLTSVPSQYDSFVPFLTAFYSKWQCRNGSPKCVGDVLFQKCQALQIPICG